MEEKLWGNVKVSASKEGGYEPINSTSWLCVIVSCFNRASASATTLGMKAIIRKNRKGVGNTSLKMWPAIAIRWHLVLFVAEEGFCPLVPELQGWGGGLVT